MTPQFSTVASTYDEYAIIQKKVGHRLLDLTPHRTYTYILDCGCGTGTGTNLIAYKFPLANVTGIDKEIAMINQANRIDTVTFLREDLDSFTHKNSADLLFSNATFQWAQSLSSIQHFLTRNTHSKSVIACTIFGPSTFKELQYAANQVSLPAASFRPMKDYRDCFEKNFTVIHADKHLYRTRFESLKDLLHSIKFTGTASKPNRIWTRRQFFEIETTFLDNFDGVFATFEVFTFILERP